MGYATPAQVDAFMEGGTVDGDVERLIERASELLDDHLGRAVYDVDDDGLPTDDTVIAVLADACCAQIEFWSLVGEDHDIEGLAGTHVRIGHLDLERLPPVLAPRAARILGGGGLLGGSITVLPAYGTCC